MGLHPDERDYVRSPVTEAGYKVGLFGKWQMTLLRDRPNHIREMGFEESAVFGWHEGPRYYEPLVYENGVIRSGLEKAYGPDVFSKYLLDFIRRNKDRPFLAYYPMVLAHDISNDLESPPPVGPKGRYETFAENVEYSDKLIGRLIDVLDELNLRENTLIIYLSDNGTPSRYITEYRDGEYIKEPVFSDIGGERIQGGKSFLTIRERTYPSSPTGKVRLSQERSPTRSSTSAISCRPS